MVTPPIFITFDCAHADGRDLRHYPLGARREVLETVLAGQRLLLAARRLPAHGLEAWAEVQRRGYEGLVAKDEAPPIWAAEPGPGSRSSVAMGTGREARTEQPAQPYRWFVAGAAGVGPSAPGGGGVMTMPLPGDAGVMTMPAPWGVDCARPLPDGPGVISGVLDAGTGPGAAGLVPGAAGFDG